MDRQNARIQVFDGNGKFLAQWKGPPFVVPMDIAIECDGTAFVVDIGDDGKVDRSGAWILAPDGAVIGHFGRYGNYDGQFLVAHGVAVGKDATSALLNTELR